MHFLKVSVGNWGGPALHSKMKEPQKKKRGGEDVKEGRSHKSGRSLESHCVHQGLGGIAVPLRCGGG